MSVRVRLRASDSGSGPERELLTLAVKTATSADDMARLAEEAQRLRQASHPGVVTLVDHHVDSDRAELHTRYAGDSLERWSGTLAQVAGVIAAVTTTLADLHEVGLVHGRIDRSHVVVGPDGRPQLCGFAPAEPAARPADDVAAVGRLLEQLIAETGTARPAPGQRRSQRPRVGTRRWLGRFRGPVAEQRALARLTTQARDPNADRRPTARALARSILAVVPGAELPSTGARPRSPQPRPVRIAEAVPEASDRSHLFEQAFVDQTDVRAEAVFSDRPWLETAPPRSRAYGGATRSPEQSRGGATRGRHRHGPATPPPSAWRSTRVKLLAVTVAATGIIGGAALLLAPTVGGRDRSGSDAAVRGHAENRSPGAIAVDNQATAAAATCARPNPQGPTSSARLVDIEGNGCLQAPSISDGVIEVAGERWAVGEPDDEIALGDWNCDGKVTPAAYRRATGDVFVFNEWADHGRPLTIEPVAQIPGGVSLVTLPIRADDSEASSCDAPAVDLGNGQRRIVEVMP